MERWFSSYEEYCDYIADQVGNYLKDAPPIGVIQISITPVGMQVQGEWPRFVMGKNHMFFSPGEYEVQRDDDTVWSK